MEWNSFEVNLDKDENNYKLMKIFLHLLNRKLWYIYFEK